MRYLSVPDFHFSPKWAETSVSVANVIANAAKEHDVDFIALPGDFFDAPIMATDKGGINTARKIMKMWTAICPVVAIEGTPSHDGPGCYGPFEDLPGFTLLKPGKTYAYKSGLGIFLADNTDQGYGCILFGIPELNKKSIQSVASLSADEANAAVLEVFRQYVSGFLATERAKYEGIPAIALLHGNVSDAHHDNETDRILKASDIVIHTEDLRPAMIDRWELGHIHTPWESEIVCAGYAGFTGMDGNPWGKRDFVPAMNLVEIGEKPIITRIPYGTPMRKKISRAADATISGVAYWLDTDKPDATLPDFVHPWSRITHTEQTQVTHRITPDQAQAIHSLSDLLRLTDPDASAEALKLIDTIPVGPHADTGPSVSVSLDYLSVKGCVLFHGHDVTLDFSRLPHGVIDLRGGNGEGKSSLLCFCTPYPAVVGKDTDSGRLSAIKDFFDQKDSVIEKRFTVNGEQHVHRITIRGAHTQSPKTECYLTINGKPMLDCGTFDEMQSACERLYGPMSDYRLTNFYEQPLQSAKANNGIMSASMTDIRNLVQNIAGIDREQEKRYCLDQVASLQHAISDAESWISGAESYLSDPEELGRKKQELSEELERLTAEGETIAQQGKEQKDIVSALQKRVSAHETEVSRQKKDLEKIKSLEFSVHKSELEIEECTKKVSKVSEYREKIAFDDKARQIKQQYDAVEARNAIASSKYQAYIASLQEQVGELKRKHHMDCQAIDQQNTMRLEKYEREKKDFEYAISNGESKIKDLKSREASLNHPCPNCGYLDPEAKAKIESIGEDIVKISSDIDDAQSALLGLTEPTPSAYPEPPKKIHEIEDEISNMHRPEVEVLPIVPEILDDYHRQFLLDAIASVSENEQRVVELRTQISLHRSEIDDLNKEQYSFDPESPEALRNATSALDELRTRYSGNASQAASCKSELKHTEQEIAEQKARSSEIKKRKQEVSDNSATLKTWQYLAQMFQANKIPALELELLTDSIDAEANRIISPYQEQRFCFRTETQVNGVDKFDIRVFDAENGIEKSFTKYSPGEKAFLSDAYTKALIRQRNDRSHRSYSPVIMDESDGPVDPDKLAAYYDIQKSYWKDAHVLVVSHSPAAHEHIENQIFIKELKK